MTGQSPASVVRFVRTSALAALLVPAAAHAATASAPDFAGARSGRGP
ncbi:hypothetical protein [Streptomyces sp. SCL15-4]|nr:hypothetical protein [Streptomyces sp. SCL15-4]